MSLSVKKSHTNILFVCKKCYTSFNSLKTINQHREECTDELSEEDALTSSLLHIDTLQSQVKIVEKELRIQRAHILWLQELLKNNSNINLGSVLEVQKDGIHLNCIGSLDPITLFLHYNEYVGPVKLATVPSKNSTKKSSPSKKRVAKKCSLAPAEETDDTQIIQTVDLKLEEDSRNYNSLEEIADDVQTYLGHLETSKMYTKHMASLRRLRSTLVGKYSLNKYKDIVQQQICDIENILEKKGYDKKKINTIVLKNITGLEARLLFYPGYINTCLEMDDSDALKSCSTLGFPQTKEYTVFNISEFQQRFCNYSSVLFSLKSSIEKALLNRYGKSNISYFPLSKSTKADPYSFYTLIETGKFRSWKLDTRLEDLSTEIRDIILPYLINIFRTIYFHVFKDNEYRKDFGSCCSVTEQDCEQLLNNIVILSKPLYFCKWLRELIVEKSTHYPTTSDRTDFERDDIEQRKRFIKPDRDDSEVEVLKEVFESLSAEHAVDIYRARIPT
jgi:hypothetical protein